MNEYERELLRDAWTLISAHRKGIRVDESKVRDWVERFRSHVRSLDGFGDLPDSDDVP